MEQERTLKQHCKNPKYVKLFILSITTENEFKKPAHKVMEGFSANLAGLKKAAEIL